MIQTERHGPTRLLRLNRPPANALDRDLMTALHQELEAAVGDGTRALVLSGSPGIFSGGLDVPALVKLDRDGIRATWEAFFGALGALATSPVPVAVAITGHAPAGGTVISLFADRRFMARGSFKLGLNEVKVGLSLTPMLFDPLERLVGPRQAEHLAATGALVEAEEALALGLVDELAPPGEVEATALAWAAELAALPPAALAGTRKTSRRHLVAAVKEAGTDLEILLDQWFSDETQAALGRLVASLAARKG